MTLVFDFIDLFFRHKLMNHREQLLLPVISNPTPATGGLT